MKDNGYYKIENTPTGQSITLLPGCIIDYEILIREIFGSVILQHSNIEIQKPKHPWEQKEDRIKVNKRTMIEIKTVGYKKRNKTKALINETSN